MKADQNGHGGKVGGDRLAAASEASRVRSIEANYEVSDVELRGIIVFLGGLFVMTAVVYLLMLLMFNLLNTREGHTDGLQSPLAHERERLPPEPRLQSAPGFAQQLGKEVGAREGETSAESDKPKDRTFELDQLEKKWADELKNGPWDQSDKPSGISIDQAKQQVLAGAGLPYRSPAIASSTAGGIEEYAVEMPTAASSGRMTEKRKQ